MNPLLLKLLPYAVAVLMVAGGVYYVYHSGYQGGAKNVKAQWDEEKAKQVAANLQAALANAKLITDLEVTKNENITTIEGLRRELVGIRVRLPRQSTCPDLPTTTGGSVHATTGTWSSTDHTQEAFDRFTGRLAEDAAYYDTLIESCRVVMAWSRSMVTEK